MKQSLSNPFSSKAMRLGFFLAVSLAIALYVLLVNRPKRSRSSKQRLVISLTTSPTRIALLKETIDSLLSQTRPADVIYVNVPHVFKRTGETYVIPSFLLRDPIRVVRCEDVGPLTKVLPTLQEEKDPETLILSVDDDIVYPSVMVATYLDYAVTYPTHTLCIIGHRVSVRDGKAVQSTYFDRIHGLLSSRVNVIEGSGGVLYRRRFLDGLRVQPGACYTSDDLVISHHLARRGVPMRKVFNASYNFLRLRLQKYGFQGDSLISLNGGTHELKELECYNSLQGL